MIVNKPKKKKKSSRYTTFFTIMIIIFTIITGKLVYLQVLKYDDYVERANNTSTKFVSEKAPRGIIYDAKGKPVALTERDQELIDKASSDFGKEENEDAE